MMANFGSSNEAAGKAYCGLEVLVKAPNGRQLRAVVADAFANEWMANSASIDVIHGVFHNLLGYETNDKNVVVRDVSWQFTGKRHNSEFVNYVFTLGDLR